MNKKSISTISIICFAFILCIFIALFAKMKSNSTLSNETIQQKLEKTIESIAGVERASVSISIPEKQIFSDGETPLIVSIILKIAPASNLAGDKTKIQKIQNLALSEIKGLEASNLVISDMDGNILNE